MAKAELPSLDCFECSICLDSMLDKRPVALSCLHTFCTPCIEKLCARQPLTCPKCRAETAVPDGDINKLPVNCDLIKIMEREKEVNRAPENLCDTCLRRGIQIACVGMCVQCVRKLCNACMGKHRKMAVFKSHQLITRNDDGSGKGDETMLCASHSETLQFICMQCMEPLCLDCVHDEKHSEHETDVEDFRTGMAKIRTKYSNQLSSIKHQIEDLDQAKKDLRSDFEVLNKAKEDLNELLSVFESKVTAVKGFMQQVSEKETSMQIVAEQIDNLVLQTQKNYSTLAVSEKLADLALLGNEKENPLDKDLKLPTKDFRDRLTKYRVPKLDINKALANKEFYEGSIGTLSEIPSSLHCSKKGSSRYLVKKDLWCCKCAMYYCSRCELFSCNHHSQISFSHGKMLGCEKCGQRNYIEEVQWDNEKLIYKPFYK